MGVYINMETPTSCGYCPLRHEARDGDECYLGASLTEYQKRPDDCPLVPVPEQHGRLVDASEKIRVQIYDDMTEDYRMVEMTIDDLLCQGWVEANAPTIIPASEEG